MCCRKLVQVWSSMVLILHHPPYLTIPYLPYPTLLYSKLPYPYLPYNPTPTLHTTLPYIQPYPTYNPTLHTTLPDTQPYPTLQPYLATHTYLTTLPNPTLQPYPALPLPHVITIFVFYLVEWSGGAAGPDVGAGLAVSEGRWQVRDCR